MERQQRIFLSHVRKDSAKVRAIYRRLRAAGYLPWMDVEDLIAGEVWRHRIESAIEESDFFVACLSTAAVNRRGFLQREIRSALDIWEEKLPEDIYLIPLRLEPCAVPKSLARFHWIDYFAPDGEAALFRSLRTGAERRLTETIQHDSDNLGAGVLPGRTSFSSPYVEEDPVDELDEQETVSPGDQRPVLRSSLPFAAFPRDLSVFFDRAAPTWRDMPREAQRFVATMGTKLEPIVQIVPATPIPLIIGFECLALGSLGESFAELCDIGKEMDAGVLRLGLALAAMKTASTFRDTAAAEGLGGARHLIFTLNLDPPMLDCDQLDNFLDTYQHLWTNNFVFEVNEKTSLRYVKRLKELQVDFNLRFSADDFNNWNSETRQALQSRVELSKVDHAIFRSAMKIRGDNPADAIAKIAAHTIAGKPLIVEGVEDPNFLKFLALHWPTGDRGRLFGQGYAIPTGTPWDTITVDLRDFGLPGGHFLAQTA